MAEKEEQSDVEVCIKFPIDEKTPRGKNKLTDILLAEQLLNQSGVIFDTGIGSGYREWFFDRSLKGAYVCIEKKGDRKAK